MGIFSDHITRVYFEPFLTGAPLIVLMICLVGMALLSAFFYRRNLPIRLVVVSLFVLALLNPSCLLYTSDAADD